MMIRIWYLFSNTYIIGKIREICPIEMYTKKHQPQRISEVHLQDPKVFRGSFYHHLYHLGRVSTCRVVCMVPGHGSDIENGLSIFFGNPYEREIYIYIFITPSWWSHQRPTPKHLPRCLHLWAAAAMVARHLRGEHDSDSSPPTCIYIYKIACDAVSPGSHFQRSFPGTVAKVVTAILRLKTHVLSKPRIQIDPFTNFY